MHAIIMAGGRGTRLGPLTHHAPKALVKVGGQAILTVILRQLRGAGFTRATLCVSHLGHLIEEELGHGQAVGLSIDYCRDVTPLGTAGPLRLVPDWDGPALVMNCDILTGLDFGALHRAHRANDALLTLASRTHRLTVDFGVLEVSADGRLLAVTEKPSIVVQVASGVQVMGPGVRRWLRDGVPMDMPELVAAVTRAGLPVHIHRFTEPWHDIGTPTGYEVASRSFRADPRRYHVEPENGSVVPAGEVS
nr:sugar phosphate nucleotidyltransferase [Micromonospora sp. DSM 115978]